MTTAIHSIQIHSMVKKMFLTLMELLIAAAVAVARKVKALKRTTSA